MGKVLKKIVGPKMGPIRAKKGGQNEVLGHFHVQNAKLALLTLHILIESYDI